MSQLILSSRVNRMGVSATLGMAQKAKELLEKKIDVVTLSAGEPDFTTPKSICEVAKLSIDKGNTHYKPVAGSKKMISAMQKKFLRDQKISYDADEVLCTVGAKSAIFMALESIIEQDDEVILFAPFWVSYIEQIRLLGGKPVVIKCSSENDFMPTYEQLAALINKKTKAVILNSPNNPSGSVINKDQLKDLFRALENTNIWLISDEIYEKILLDNIEHLSPANLNSDMRRRTVVISGLSKAYAMTGWRVGVVAGDRSVIGAMVKLQGQHTTCLPGFVQDAAAFALNEDDVVKKEIKEMVDAYRERRDLGLALFNEIAGLKVFKPRAAFYLWVDFSRYARGDDVDFAVRMLNDAHVAAVPGTPFGYPGFLRFSIASKKEDIGKAIVRIKEWLSTTFMAKSEHA